MRLQSTLGDFASLVARKMGAGWHPENMRFWLRDRAPGGPAHACLPCYVPGGEHAKTPMSAPALTYAGFQQDRLDKGLAAPSPGRRSQEASGSTIGSHSRSTALSDLSCAGQIGRSQLTVFANTHPGMANATRGIQGFR